MPMESENVSTEAGIPAETGVPPVDGIPLEAKIPPESVRIHTDFITLQDLLKLTGAVDTGGEAKVRIQNGETLVNDAVCTQRGKKLRPGDTVQFRGRLYTVAHGN